ncbi:MAG: hypothetical protein ABIH68_02425 [bacterium]
MNDENIKKLFWVSSVRNSSAEQDAGSNGASMVFALFLMCFFTIISFSLVLMIKHESKNTVKSFLSQRALYAAEAGVERKIAELRENSSTSAIALTVFTKSEYMVNTVSSLGDNQYNIVSTGYAPAQATAAETRKISVVVKIVPFSIDAYTDGIAMRSTGDLTIDQDVTIKGGLYSNGQIALGANVTITDSEAGAGDGQIRSAYEFAQAVDFGANCIMSGSNPKIYANGTITNRGQVTGDNLDNPADFIEGAGSVEPLPEADWPAFDVDGLLDGNQTEYTGTPENISGVFDLSAGNGVHEFKGGVYFDAGTVFTGSGTIIVTGGNGDYGIEMDNTIGSSTTYAAVNLIVIDGTWTDKAIYTDQTCYIAGAIIGSFDVSIDQNVNLRGVIDCKGKLESDQSVTVEYAAPEWSLPDKSDTGGNITVISWQEVPAS